ncbi:hypothetical protein ACLQ2R_00415 [Streptosporangium sp. DT93]|uniref:hypothetical protein n=1 Tax=Streptosporangium sp. DT93 TaxID=3393428 RepID=UPI0036198DA3
MVTHRTAVVPLDSETSGRCLCGHRADYVIETRWFSGRHSRDPVCSPHVTEVLQGIAKQNARRDGG